MTHQPVVGGVCRSRHRLHRLVEFGRGDERVLALRFDRVLEYAGGEQLRLVCRRAAVGVLGGDHLPLLGDPQAPLDRPRGLGGDRATGGRAAPTHRPAATVEKRDRHAALRPEPREPVLRLRELPVRREEASILVRVGVADHDLVDTALRPDAAPDQGYLE